MSEFKFKVKEYFIRWQIGVAGVMIPDNFPTVNKFTLKLVSKDKILHVFELIGEEKFFKTPSSINARAFRTADNIKNILDSENISDLYIIGFDNEFN